MSLKQKHPDTCFIEWYLSNLPKEQQWVALIHSMDTRSEPVSDALSSKVFLQIEPQLNYQWLIPGIVHWSGLVHSDTSSYYTSSSRANLSSRPWQTTHLCVCERIEERTEEGTAGQRVEGESGGSGGARQWKEE